jgi:hypothetical protein
VEVFVQSRWLFPVVFVLAAVASHLPLRAEQPASQPIDEFQPAIQSIRAARFEEAEGLLRLLIEHTDRQDIAHLYLAIAVLRQEEAKPWPSRARLREVERLCTRAVQLNDRLVAARLVRASVCLWLDEQVSARADLRRVADDLSRAADQDYVTALVDDVTPLLERVERECRPWDLSLHLGLDYDTNVPQIGRNVGIPRDFGRRKDLRFGSSFDFNYRPHISDHLELGLGGGVSSSWHADLDEFDEQGYRSHAYVRYRATDWLDLGLRYEYEFSLLGREDYLSRHRVTPYLSILEDFRGRTTVYYQFEPQRFFDVPAVVSSPPFDRSGDLHAVGLTQELTLGQLYAREVLFEVGYRYENVSTSGTEYDSRISVLSVGLTVPLSWDLTFFFAGEWAWEDYKRRSTLDRFRRRREDFVQMYLFGLSRQITENVVVQGQILWVDDDSNVITADRAAVFSYDRVVYGVSVLVRF